MDRRVVLLALLSTGAAPLASYAQPAGKVWRVGFLAARSRSTPANPDPYYDAFVQAMRDLGYVEGKNLLIEWRFANGQYERLSDLAKELVQIKVDVIVTHALPPTLAAKQATSTIPIVVAAMSDPVGNGVVKSLARPEGNITGFSSMSAEVVPKQVELLSESIAKLSRIAFFVNPLAPSHLGVLKSAEASAKKIGASVLTIDARDPAEIERGFAKMASWKAQAAIVPADAMFLGQGDRFAQLALKHRIALISEYRQHVEAGALMAYGTNFVDYYRKATTLVDKLLKGAKPSELPFEQPLLFEFVVNQKTAKALGIKIPQSILLRANQVLG
jgi:putative ABC transport system substrate-binding protein